MPGKVRTLWALWHLGDLATSLRTVDLFRRAHDRADDLTKCQRSPALLLFLLRSTEAM